MALPLLRTRHRIRRTFCAPGAVHPLDVHTQAARESLCRISRCNLAVGARTSDASALGAEGLFALLNSKMHPSAVNTQPTIRRPKSGGRCIHCREELTAVTKDHVFPSCWYPDSTPSQVQRWTAPSCQKCNEYFGELEKDLLVYLACCVDPAKTAAQGLYERVRRTLGIGVEELSDEERQHREARRRKLLNEAQPYSAEIEPHILPGLGPHPEAPANSQMQVRIKAESIHEVVRKFVRGCEYWLAGGRVVEAPYEINIFFPAATPEDVDRLMASFAFGPVHLGPGLRIRRGAAHDEPLSVIYELVIWDTLIVYASILPHAAEESQDRSNSDAELAVCAYYHWEHRGKPLGSPEVDWFWAVDHLKQVSTADS